jgi:arsenite-transporting ATPase
MQEKHRFMVRTLTRAYRSDEADAFLREMSRLVSALESTLTDPARCAAVMVTNAQPLVLDETRRYLQSLAELHIDVAGVVWNGSDSAELETQATQVTVPRLDEWPIGVEGLERWAAAMRPAPSARVARERQRATVSPPANLRAVPQVASIGTLLRSLTIVAGKGGVGKTTVATALALLAAGDRDTLLVSTDPAPSLSDALAQPIPDAETLIHGTSRVWARQMDASAAFARLRTEYQARVDAAFDALVGRSMDLSHDRAITRELLSLAPPGIDEVYALSLISEALFDRHFE